MFPEMEPACPQALGRRWQSRKLNGLRAGRLHSFTADALCQQTASIAIQKRLAGPLKDSAARQRDLFRAARPNAHAYASITRIFPGIFAIPFILRPVEQPRVIQVEGLPQSADQPVAVDDVFGGVVSLKEGVHGGS